MTIQEAKSKLYATLSDLDEVVGAAVHGYAHNTDSNEETIVIFLSKKSKKVIKLIPSTYEGYKVSYEIKGVIRAL